LSLTEIDDLPVDIFVSDASDMPVEPMEQKNDEVRNTLAPNNSSVRNVA